MPLVRLRSRLRGGLPQVHLTANMCINHSADAGFRGSVAGCPTWRLKGDTSNPKRVESSEQSSNCKPGLFNSASRSSMSTEFAPSDGKAVFASTNTSQLVFAWGLLELCRWRFLTDFGTRLLSKALSPGAGRWGKTLLWATRRTAFAHFCGGETLQACIQSAQQLYSTQRARCIFDWTVEEREDPLSWDSNAARKIDTLRKASAALKASAAFMPVKLTALLSPALLERITAIISTSEGSLLPDGWICTLTKEEQQLLQTALTRLGCLCQVSKDLDVPLLFDAEQSNRQPAVHLICRELQKLWNVDGQVVVYDTLQMYLQRSPAQLEISLASARAGSYTYAVKLVRGAYLEQEQPLGSVMRSKKATDAAYNAAAEQLLSCIARCPEHRCFPQVAVLIATHNRYSLEQAVQHMARLGIVRDHKHIHFGQILGMVDNLTGALGLAGYNATKLVVFGEMREVLPWLLRRIQENRDAFGAQAAEMPVLRAELRRRMLPFQP